MKENINILCIVVSVILAIISGIISFSKLFIGIILLIISLISLLFFGVKFRHSQKVKKDSESGDVQTGKISLAMEEQKSQQIDSHEQDKELDGLQEENLIVKKNKPIVKAAKRDLEMLDAKLMKKQIKDNQGLPGSDPKSRTNQRDINIKQLSSHSSQGVTTRSVMKSQTEDLGEIDKNIVKKLEETNKKSGAGDQRKAL